MRLICSDKTWDDYIYWQQTDKQILKKITDEHRLVYEVSDNNIAIASCRYYC